MTQDFFLQVLRGRYFEHLDQSKGRFRAYLSVALQNFLHDRWRRWTWRRGRGAVILSLEAEEAEEGYESALWTSATPESLYERQWAQTVIRLVLQQLKIELAADKKEDLFDVVLASGTRNFAYKETAQALGLSIGALHATLHRWRRRFQTLMREEIARTVLLKTEVDDELRHLFERLRSD